jgi:hypothetical protein
MGRRTSYRIVNKNTGEIFDSMKALANILGVRPSSVCSHLRGYTKTLKGEEYTYEHTYRGRVAEFLLSIANED